MRNRLLAVGAALLVGVVVWRFWAPGDERAIRGRLADFTREFNESTTDGLGTVARAARLGSFFTEDVVVDLGQGSAPIHGRETLIGMAARLQPRTGAFALELDDISVAVGPDGAAEVNLTAAFRRRSAATGDETLDAREFRLGMVRAGGEWRIGRVTAVDTLK
jgi:SnoaL-like domain